MSSYYIEYVNLNNESWKTFGPFYSRDDMDKFYEHYHNSGYKSDKYLVRSGK